MFKFKFNLLIATTAIPLILLLAIPHNALAWDFDPWFGQPEGFDNYGQLGSGSGAYNNGYYAGQQDAIYDHDNNLVL
jgi:hypothetical protein